MKKTIAHAPIVRLSAAVCEIFFSDIREKTFSAKSIVMSDHSTLMRRFTAVKFPLTASSSAQ
jgi:hypothetical protein